MARTTYIPSIHIGDGNKKSGNILNSFNTVYKSDEDAQIMRWLSPLEPNNRHQDVRTDRFDGVGNWLLETSEFREWRDEGGADKAILFCSGNPGVGKTYLSSLVIDSLCDQVGRADAAVAGLYCDYLSQKEQTVTNMMGTILGQLVGGGGIPNYLRNEFQQSKNKFGGRRPRLPDVVRMLRIAIRSLHQVFICIDALDECLPKHLPEFLESLRDIVRECPSTRIFLTGRPHVREDVQRYFARAIVIPMNPNPEDIENYLEMRINRDSEPEAMNDCLRADIVRVIQEKISDIFLLVSLNMDAILGEVTIRQRRKKLEEMSRGNGLSDAYTATLTRLKGQKGNKSILGLKVLMWVVYSQRPLRAEELRHALGVEAGSADSDVENVPALRILLASCLGLVTVEVSSSTVRLVHFTLQEHLSSDPTLFHSPHSSIAEVCLTYLNFGYVWNLSPTLDSAPLRAPLLEYASCYWGEHARMGMTESMKRLALRLLDRFDEHISARLMLLHHDRAGVSGPYFHGIGGPIGFTGLHAVAFLGVMGIEAAVLEMKEWDVNATDCMGSTALVWAAARGHEGVLKVLLEQPDVNPGQADTKYGRTPLSWAAEYGHEGVVKMLLGRADVNPDQAGTRYGRTPLSRAAGGGHRGVVKMLLERADVNPDRADIQNGRTPLSWAAQRGSEGVVRMLLERADVDPDRADTEYGQTPLSWAAKSGYEAVVKILLERADINPNQADTQYGQTPLSWAARNGHEEVVKMLLERADVNPNQADTQDGQTPLLHAAGNGHEGVVKMLLERADVNPNQADTQNGQTPLSWATMNRNGGVAKMLLERADVNPNQADTQHGWTPLLWAANRGYEDVVKLLLKRADVNPDLPDTQYGLTPLSWAALHGCEGVVKMLLERADVNPDQADTKYGRTPLSWAVENMHEGVVKVLLERKNVDPNQIDTTSGWTPLVWAAKNGYEGVIRVLLEREDVNPNAADTQHGRTPLSWAAGEGHERIVNLLLERKDIHTATPDDENLTPLRWALSSGHYGIARILEKQRNIKSDTTGSAGKASLPHSSGHEGDSVVDIQLQADDPKTDITDLNTQHAIPSVDPSDLSGVWDTDSFVSISAGNDIPPTKPSTPPKPLSNWPMKFWYPPSEADAHPKIRPILSVTVDRYIIIASFICILSVLVYILPYSSSDLFSSRD